MPTDVRRPTDESVTSLISGIIDDAQDLLTQQLALFRGEIQADFHKTKEAAAYVAAGAVLAVPGAFLLCLTLVHLLHWATSPPGADPASLPLWACYGLVGALFAVPSAILTSVGVTKFRSFNPLPDESVEALTENLQWISDNK